MTPDEWNKLELPDGSIKQFKSVVSREARTFLETLLPGETINTNNLVEALYPRDIAAQSLQSDLTRTRIYTLIGQLAISGLEDCCVKGEVQGTFYGKPKRPWIWFCPVEREVCPHCGQFLAKESE